MTIRFISDLHFFHKNVIDHDDRQFSSLDEMHDTMIKNWNAVVQPDDETYVLGDIAMGSSPAKLEAILQQLNGKIHYIYGNHEKETYKDRITQYFESTSHYTELELQTEDGKDVIAVLSHYPMVSYHGSYRENYIHLYGHVHNSTDDTAYQIAKLALLEEEQNVNLFKSVNVGCMWDYIDYTPRTIDELLEIAVNQNEELLTIANQVSHELDQLRRTIRHDY